MTETKTGDRRKRKEKDETNNKKGKVRRRIRHKPRKWGKKEEG